MGVKAKEIKHIFYQSLQKLLDKGYGVFYLGVSGGVDSMALLKLFMDQQEEEIRRNRQAFSLIVLHFNHQLRDFSADSDQAFVEGFCKSHGIECRVGSGQVKDLAEREGISIELAARQARYDFFDKEMKKDIDQRKTENKKSILCLGHHANDQTESILLHLFRGSGLQGLEGMKVYESAGDRLDSYIYRPLLNVLKEDLLSFCEEEGVDWVEDESNQEDSYTRNYLRLHILPEIRQNINPNLDQAMGRLAEIVGEENNFFDQLVGDILQSWEEDWTKASGIMQSRDGRTSNFLSQGPIKFDSLSPSQRNALLLEADYIGKKDFTDQAVAIQRRLLLAYSHKKQFSKDLNFEGLEEIRHLFYGKANKRKSLCDRIFLSDYDGVLIFPEETIPRKKGQEEDQNRIKEFQEGQKILTWDWPKIEFSIQAMEDLSEEEILEDQSVCYFDGRNIDYIYFRTYQEGDMFQKFAGKTKELRKCFNDWKLSSILRKDYPILVANGDILWVPFLGRSDHFKVAKTSQIYGIRARIL